MREDDEWFFIGSAALFGILVLGVLLFSTLGFTGTNNQLTDGVSNPSVEVEGSELRGLVVNNSREVNAYRYKRGNEIGYVDRRERGWMIRSEGELVELGRDNSTYTLNEFDWVVSNSSEFHDPLARLVDTYFRNSSVSVVNSFRIGGELRHEIRTNGSSNATHVVSDDGRLIRVIEDSDSNMVWRFFYGETVNLISLTPAVERNQSVTEETASGDLSAADKVKQMRLEVGRIAEIQDTDTVRAMVVDGSDFTSRRVELVGLEGVDPNEEINPEKFGEGFDADCLRSVGFSARDDLESTLGNNTYIKVTSTEEAALGDDNLIGYVYLGNFPVEVPRNYDRLLNYRVVEKGYANVTNEDFEFRSDFVEARNRARENNRGIWGCD